MTSIVTKVFELQTQALSTYEVITTIVHNVYGMEMLPTMLDVDSLVSQTVVDNHAHICNLMQYNGICVCYPLCQNAV
jgi:hypothetical protein